MKEIWKSIPELEHYEAFNLGRIRSVDRIMFRENRWPNDYKFQIKGKVLVSRLNWQRYVRVNVVVEQGVIRTKTVHSLVAAAFLGPRLEKVQINHKDGNKQNNSISNLEYCTQSENALHACRLGLCRALKGSKHPFAKINEKKARRLVELRKQGMMIKDLANMFGLSISCTRKVLDGITWSAATGIVPSRCGVHHVSEQNKRNPGEKGS